MRKIILALFLILLIFPLNVQADGSPSLHTWKELNQTSDQILQLVKQEKFTEAKQLMGYFSVSFLEMDFRDEGITMSALRAVTLAFEKAEESVTATEMPLEQRISQVTAFRLAVDALSSEYHPLWLHSEESIMNALNLMEESVKQKDSQAYQIRMNQFLEQYEKIRPALYIDTEPQQLQRIDSQITYLDHNRAKSLNEENLIQHIDVMKDEWTNLYKRVKEDSADPSLWWVMFTIGGMITTSLSYVGWRKYRAEKKKVHVKQ
ncbi:sporulation protein YpjB [Bacillus suaedae]|uniref:Sporulation protein YpjB n=1 Tax=Halalkalibacter suaedae TaxID=2822140 RepID=A0A940WY47_9BACI|nr:sporulation protein YpjB [Bacillus suaedae]MBP3950610.1 sporulation protein YpjB [Bacillus suaedae]